MKNQLIVALLASALLGAGYLLGHYGGHESPNKLATNHANSEGPEIVASAPASSGSSIEHEVYSARGDKNVEPITQSSTATIVNILHLDSEFAQYHATYQLAAALSETELNRYLQQVKALSDQHARAGLSRILFSRYVAIDGQRALDSYFAGFYGNERWQRNLLSEIYHEWALLAPKQAVASIDSLTPLQLQIEVITGLLIDPVFMQQADIQALLSKLPDDQQWQVASRVVLNQGPEQAFFHFLAMPANDPSRHIGLSRSLHRWAELDPKAALTHVDDIDYVQERDWLRIYILQRLAKVDSALAITEALKIKGQGNARINPLVAVLSELAKAQGEQAMQLAHEYQQYLGVQGLGQVVAGWAQSDPRAAAAYWQLHPDTASNNQVMSMALNYAAKYPQEALDWSLKNNLPEFVLSNVFNQMADLNPEQLERYLDDIRFAKQHGNILSALIQRKSQYDLDEAKRWLNQHQGEAGYQQAQNTLLSRWIEQKPAEAAAQVIADDKTAQRLLPMLVGSWNRIDSEALQSWLLALPDSNMRDKGLSFLVTQVARDDMARADSLLAGIGDEKLYLQVKQRLQQISQRQQQDHQGLIIFDQ